MCCSPPSLSSFGQSLFSEATSAAPLFVMAEEHIMISAQIPHPFKLGTYFQAFWPETRQPGVAGGGASSPLALTQGASGASPRRGSHGWGSSCDEDERDSGSRLAPPWVS